MKLDHCYQGDCRTVMRDLIAAGERVKCIVTSPPYFALRDYGLAGQIGAESNIDAWVTALRIVTQQMARVLVPQGSFWLNLGDSYARSTADGAAHVAKHVHESNVPLQRIRAKSFHAYSSACHCRRREEIRCRRRVRLGFVLACPIGLAARN